VRSWTTKDEKKVKRNFKNRSTTFSPFGRQAEWTKLTVKTAVATE